MSVRITNLSRGLLTVELNSGTSLHLAPQETSEPLADLDVESNRWIQKLLDRDDVVVEEVDEPRSDVTRRTGRGARKG